MDDVILIAGDDEDDEAWEDEGEFDGLWEEEGEEEGELEAWDDEGEEGGFLDGGGLPPGASPLDDDPGPEVLTGNVPWGDEALAAARDVLSRPDNSNLRIYLFRALAPSKTVEVRLDRLDDRYGSPDVDDIERFSRAFAQELERRLGAEAAGEVGLEVSSPGAERTLVVPQDLERFRELPMRVEFMSEVGQLVTMVLRYVDMDQAADMTTWELADVKANQQVKGRGLSKRQRAQRYSIRLSELERVRIYVDF